jgi:hypothetical protein
MESGTGTTVPSHALVHEIRKVDNDNSTEELKTVPDKLAIEDKYIVDYPIDESITVPNKQILKIYM